MESTPVGVEEHCESFQPEDGQGTIRVIVADTQAIFRAGLRKIFALEDDLRVVGQAETLPQTISAVQKFSADILIFEAALTPTPAEAVSDLLRHHQGCRIVVVLPEPNQELTLELLRRGAHAIVSREVEPETLVDCLRKVAHGEPWLEPRAMAWVLEAFRTQGTRPTGSRPKVQLTPKESLIVSCVTQGMKNKEIALRVGTTEQVVKNYLRKVYDKLGVADRLELALFCLNHRVIDGDGKAGEAKPSAAPATNAATPAPATPAPQPANMPAQAADKTSAASAGSGNHS
jgi:DNA-binding NarL/FixJ family response regulator